MFFKYSICENITEPKKELEPFILEKPRTCYEYSKRVLKKRWIKGEKAIIKYYEDVYPYCSDELEYIYLYAKNVLKSRWDLGEELLVKYAKEYEKQKHWGAQAISNCLSLYSKHVIKGRWKEIERYIISSNQIGNYLDSLQKEKDIKEFKIAIQLNALKGDKFAINFNTWIPTHKIKLKGKSSFDVMMVKSLYKGHTTSPSFLAFQLEEWLTQAENYKNKEHCFTYFVLGKKVDKESSPWCRDTWVKNDDTSIDDIITTNNNGSSWLFKGKTNKRVKVSGQISKISLGGN